MEINEILEDVYPNVMEELDELTNILEDVYLNVMEDTQINDLLWFNFEYVCELLGLEYDEDKGEIVRH